MPCNISNYKKKFFCLSLTDLLRLSSPLCFSSISQRALLFPPQRILLCNQHTPEIVFDHLLKSAQSVTQSSTFYVSFCIIVLSFLDPILSFIFIYIPYISNISLTETYFSGDLARIRRVSFFYYYFSSIYYLLEICLKENTTYFKGTNNQQSLWLGFCGILLSVWRDSVSNKHRHTNQL